MNDLEGINIEIEEKELIIRGNQSSFLELAEYIISLATSNQKVDHLHLDDLTLINKNSKIKDLIFEKTE